MRDEAIVILSSDDWGWKTSKYQLSTRFATTNRVLFVSSIGFRAPTASRADLSRIWRKLGGFFQGPKQVDSNIWVLTPIVIPFWKGRIVDWINRKIFSIQLLIASRSLSIRDPFLFVFSPNWQQYVDHLDYKKLVYYCVDEHSGFEGVDASRFLAWDDSLTKNADYVFCSARFMFEKKKLLNSETHYLPHGVNWSLFAESDNCPAEADKSLLQSLRGPIMLFFGHISYEWVDTHLLKYVADQRPGWNIVLVGRNSIDANEFAMHTNIHMLGERDYEDLPALCRFATAGIIPFVDSKLTAACNPLKLLEYLAAGLPVVSTDIPEVRRHADIVFVARSKDAFVEACESAIQVDQAEYSPRVSALARQHDWNSRVDKIYSLITV